MILSAAPTYRGAHAYPRPGPIPSPDESEYVIARAVGNERGPPVSDELLRQVAEIVAHNSFNPRKVVAWALFVSDRTASRWIANAKNKGLIEGSSSGCAARSLASESLVYGAPNHRWPCRGADTAWAGLAAVMAPRTTCSRTRGYTEAEQRRPLGHVPVGPARGERVPHFSTANPTFELESSASAPLRSARRRQQLRNPRPKPTTLSSASRGNGRQAHGGTGLCSWRLLLIAKLIRKLLHRPVFPITRSERALTCSSSGHLAWPCAKTAVGPSSKLWSLPREGGHPCRHQIFFVAAPVSRLQLR
jgi:hypothetical protein